MPTMLQPASEAEEEEEEEEGQGGGEEGHNPPRGEGRYPCPRTSRFRSLLPLLEAPERTYLQLLPCQLSREVACFL
jgi:hypothetical protein